MRPIVAVYRDNPPYQASSTRSPSAERNEWGMSYVAHVCDDLGDDDLEGASAPHGTSGTEPQREAVGEPTTL